MTLSELGLNEPPAATVPTVTHGDPHEPFYNLQDSDGQVKTLMVTVAAVNRRFSMLDSKDLVAVDETEPCGDEALMIATCLVGAAKLIRDHYKYMYPIHVVDERARRPAVQELEKLFRETVANNDNGARAVVEACEAGTCMPVNCMDFSSAHALAHVARHDTGDAPCRHMHSGAHTCCF